MERDLESCWIIVVASVMLYGKREGRLVAFQLPAAAFFMLHLPWLIETGPGQAPCVCGSQLWRQYTEKCKFIQSIR